MPTPPRGDAATPERACRGGDRDEAPWAKRQKLDDSAERNWGANPLGEGAGAAAFGPGEATVACKEEPEDELEDGDFLGDPLFNELAVALGLKQEAGEASGAGSERESTPACGGHPAHPSEDPALVELGTLRLPFKVCKGQSVAGISGQAIQYADASRVTTKKSMVEKHAGKLTVWHMPDFCSDKLELLPIPCPPQCRIDLPAEVAVRVTLMDFDGLAQARSYGVRVASRTTATEVAWALQQQHSIELRVDQTLLLYSLHDHKIVTHGSQELRLDLVHNKDYPGAGPGFIAYRVPVGNKQAFIAVRHENANVKKDPTALELEGTYFGTPLLLPVHRSALLGGQKARTDILAAVRLALSAYHFYGSVTEMEDVPLVFKGHANPHLFPNGKAIAKDIEVPLSNCPYLKAVFVEESTVTCSVGYVTVQWDPRRLGDSFDLDQFNSPALDSSVATVDVEGT
ncbi:unnamed protein product [Ostreobium quekettii]|uniref:Uncharacterized protein n=1 Tax=Ostreobium quekettii TaxID=121088 RepID=A0A8S1IPV8_9CHLO|nr:unnamed protein product [Ostreobium quekettii]